MYIGMSKNIEIHSRNDVVSFKSECNVKTVYFMFYVQAVCPCYHSDYIGRHSVYMIPIHEGIRALKERL